MKRILLDTDMGVDCDDAVALSLLLRLKQQKKCTLEGVTASTTREGACACIRAILRFYGETADVGRLSGPALSCDSQNNYARAVMRAFCEDDAAGDAVDVLRAKLAQAKERLTLVAIGPLTNIAQLLRSGGDGFSPLSGGELVRQKADRLYLMAGCFTDSEGNLYRGAPTEREWNVLQDVQSARFVAENFPLEMVYVPFEAGNRVFTGGILSGYERHPAHLAMREFRRLVDDKKPEIGYERESWDPVTCLVAVTGGEGLFELSEPGRIAVDETGRTVYRKADNGLHRYLIPKNNFQSVADRINSLL